MDDQTIRAIVGELAPLLVGQRVGKIFQLSRASLAFDFRAGDNRYLFISVEPSSPRLYSIARRVRDLEKQSLPPSPFLLTLRKHLGGATLLALGKDTDERIVRLSFKAQDELGDDYHRTLVAQLTGRAANLLLLDERGYIIDALRPPRGEGQQTADRYEPPPPQAVQTIAPQAFKQGRFSSLNEAADAYYTELEASRAFQSRVATARARLRKEITQREKLRRHLQQDMAAHGDAAAHKRAGDLLLANLATAERSGSKVFVTDYYADDAPRIEIEIDEHSTLQEEAARRFTRYTKAKRAAEEIARRLEILEAELAALRARETALEETIETRDESALETFAGGAKKEAKRARAGGKTPETIPGVRRYRSSDGYEILVGRAARDNDHLTFRVARPNDLWLHAADYPGSHVVVRNQTRAELPQRTVIEAAQLAAAFSQARRDAKVNVHYTLRKFLAKPKGAAPGLVRLSSFRTLTVEPREALERL